RPRKKPTTTWASPSGAPGCCSEEDVPGLQAGSALARRVHQPEAVAVDVDDFYVGIFPEVFAQLRDVDVHAAPVEVGVAAPDLFQRLLPGQQVVLVLAEHAQQLVFLGG